MDDQNIYKCVQYFKQLYTRHNKFARCECLPTEFHNALTNGDLEFVKTFLAALDTEELVDTEMQYMNNTHSINSALFDAVDLPIIDTVPSENELYGSCISAYNDNSIRSSMVNGNRKNENTNINDEIMTAKSDIPDAEGTVGSQTLKQFVLNMAITSQKPWERHTSLGVDASKTHMSAGHTTPAESKMATCHNDAVNQSTTGVEHSDPSSVEDGSDTRAFHVPETCASNATNDHSLSLKWGGRWWVGRWADGLIQCCLTMALYSRNTQLMQVLLAEGADPTKCDSDGENCVHHLVRIGDKWPDLAVDMFVFLRETLSSDVLKAVLKQENVQRRNPLDLSAKLGIPEMMLCILNTPNVYKFQIAQFGNKVCSVYDIGEYEGKGRKADKSVLFRLTDMDEDQVVRARRCELLSREPIRSWYEMKYAAYHTVKIMFISFWVIFVSVFYFNVIMTMNTVCDPTLWSYLMSLMNPLTSIISLLYIVCECSYIKEDLKMMIKSFRETLFSKKFPVTFTFAYRVFQMLFAISMFAMYLVEGDVKLGLMTVNSILSIFALLMFFQLSSSLGHVLLVLQKMMFDVALFASMDVLVFFAFTMAFHLLYVVGNADHCNTNSTSTNTSIAGNLTLPNESFAVAKESSANENPFHDFYSSGMYIFLMTLGIVAPSDMTFESAPLPVLASVLYSMMIITGGIVFINLLIAVMSARLDEVNQCKEEILKLEKLCILQYMEVRLKTRLSRRLMRRLLSLRCMRAHSERRTRSPLRPFMFDAEQTELFLEVVEEVKDAA